MNQALDIEHSRQGGSVFGVKILSSSIGASASSQGRILDLIMIGMDIGCGTDSGERMLAFHPLDPTVALRPLDFHSDFEAFPPHFAFAISPRGFADLQPDTG